MFLLPAFELLFFACLGHEICLLAVPRYHALRFIPLNKRWSLIHLLVGSLNSYVVPLITLYSISDLKSQRRYQGDVADVSEGGRELDV